MLISLHVFPVLLFSYFYLPIYGLYQSTLHGLNLDFRQRNFIRQLKGFSSYQLNNLELNETIYDYHDKAYYINITIGCQPFLVIADTGSPVFWVADSECQSKVCLEKHRFHRELSKCYQSVQNKTFDLQYGTGSAKGIYGMDTVEIGSPPLFTIPNTLFGQATEMAEFFTNLPEMDGILGLGPFCPDGVDSPIFNAFNKKILPRKLITIYFKCDGVDAEGLPGGTITWGDIDHVNCEKDIYYVPLLPSDGHWAFEIQSVCHRTYCNDKIKKAVTDSGCSEIVGPAYAVMELWKSIGVNQINGTIPCDANFEPIILTIAGYDYELSKETLILKSREYKGQCFIRIIPSPKNAGEDDFWLLGAPFIQQFCQIHDFEQKRIGFAVAKQSEQAGRVIKRKK